MKTVNWLVGGMGAFTVFSQGSPGAANSLPHIESNAIASPATIQSSLSRPLEPQDLCDSPSSRAPAADGDACSDDLNSMAQVPSVSELSDVKPTDWAYQALKSLVERYGVVVGDSNGTFRGNAPLTRYEFAAVLNQVRAVIEQITTTGPATQLQEDLTTLRQLQATYGAIATDLQKRLDLLTQKNTTLTQQQFSTTSQLTGQTVLALTDGTRAKSTLLSRVRLDLRTSFSGQDLLVTQIEAGNNGGDAISQAHNHGQNLLGTTGLLADGGGLDSVAVTSNVRLSKLYYTFQPTPGVSLAVGARLSPRDFIDYNRFANESATNFASSFFSNNPFIVQNQIDQPGGAGAALTWAPGNLPLTVRAFYAATDADRTQSGLTKGGLFGDRNQGSVEAEYAFSRDFTVRLQYTNATINNTHISAAGINTEWLVSQQVGVFGRFGFGRYTGFNSQINQQLDLNPVTWAIGATVGNLVIPGSTVGLAIGQPFLESHLGNATQTNIEAFYSFLLNDNISFSPTLMVVTNPNNNRSGGTIWEWAVRMVYSF